MQRFEMESWTFDLKILRGDRELHSVLSGTVDGKMILGVMNLVQRFDQNLALKFLVEMEACRRISQKEASYWRRNRLSSAIKVCVFGKRFGRCISVLHFY